MPARGKGNVRLNDRSSVTAHEPGQKEAVASRDGQQHLDLHELFQSLSSVSAVASLPDLLPQLARIIATSIGGQRCSVFLFDKQVTRITDHLRWGYDEQEQPLLDQASMSIHPADNPAFREVIDSRNVLIRNPGTTSEGLLPTNARWRDLYWPGDMMVPLVWGCQVEGVAIIIRPDDLASFEPLHAEIAQGVARQAAGIINHLRTIEAEREARQQTEMLLNLSRTFSSANSVLEIYSNLAQAVQTLLGLHAVSIVVREHSVFAKDSSATRRVTSLGMRESERRIRDLILKERSKLDSTIDQLATQADGPLIIEDVQTRVDDDRLKQDYIENGVSQLLAIPVTPSGELHGVLYGWSRHVRIAASDEALQIAGIMASHAAESIERLLLVEAERRLRQRSEIIALVNRQFADIDDPLVLMQIAAGAVRRALRADLVVMCAGQPDESAPFALVGEGGNTDLNSAILAAMVRRVVGPESVPATEPGARVMNADEVSFWLSAEQEPDLPDGAERLAAIALPVQLPPQPCGVLHAWFSGPTPDVNQSDLATIEDITVELERALERINLLTRERREWNRSEMLLSYADMLNRSPDLPSVTTSILRTIRQQLPGVHAALAQRDADITGGWQTEPPGAFASGRAYHDLLDAAATNRTRQTGRVHDVTVLAVPLIAGDELSGVLVLARPGVDSISDTDYDVASTLAPQSADAIQRARLYAVSERTVAELALLHEVGRAVAQRRGLPEIFDYIAVEIRNLVDYSIGLLSLDGHDRDHLEIVSIWGDTPPDALGERIPIDASIMGTVYRSHEPVVVDDVRQHPVAWAVDRAPWRSLICVPLMTGARAIGALLVGHPEPGKFTREDVRLASLLAGQAGAAIYQAREADRQRELYRAGVEALAAAVDAKDSYTHSHSRQVAELSRRTAEALGLDTEEVERIELAGLLHDVGKIGIPDHILTKPGRLDQQERLLMIGHAALGARIVAAHPALAELSDLVLHHHEWHNGSGYPDGLRGDEVPIGSAIIAVADAFDSMTTYRPYRSALGFEAAREELLKWSGVQFHPRVLEAFLSTIVESDSEAQELPAQSVDMRPIRAVDIIAPRVMAQVATEIVGLTDLYPFLDRLQQIIRDELKYDEVHIFLTEDDDNELVLAASTIHSEMVGRLRLTGGNILAGEAARTRTLVNSGEILEDPRAGFIDLDSRSGLEVPLIVEGELVGILGAASADPHRFEARDEALMDAIARQIAPTVMVARLHDYTRRTASIDGLTGVMNHRAFYLRLEEMIAAMDDWDNDLHLLIVDVVGLKAVNDVYGHLAGDRALIAIANALKNRVRSEDEVARYGGDEFVVIVRGTPRGGLTELAARITAPVEFTLDEGYTMTIRLRCGVATANSTSERATELVARADAGLYNDIRPTERGHDDN